MSRDEEVTPHLLTASVRRPSCVKPGFVQRRLDKLAADPGRQDSTTVTELAEARDAVERLIDRPARQERTQQQRADEARRRP